MGKGKETYEDLMRRPEVLGFLTGRVLTGVAAREPPSDATWSPGRDEATGELLMPSASSNALFADRVLTRKFTAD